MTSKISDTALSQLSDLVASKFGMHFPKKLWPDLERRAHAAAQEQGQQNLNRYVQLLCSGASPRELEALATHLTVGETYFFREKRSLEILKQHIVPEMARVRAGRQLRIWSAGCATGEEPYSIAIMLSRMTAESMDRNATILATDLNAVALHRASEGVFGDWSFRDTPQWVKNGYFETTSGGLRTIAPAVKKMVTFARLNLMDDVYPSLVNGAHALDVIFCRNVLMYFTPEAMRKVVGRFHRLLAPEGWLIVSPTETSCELFSEFTTISFGDVTLYQKPAVGPQVSVGSPAHDGAKFLIQAAPGIPVSDESSTTSSWAHQEPPGNESCLLSARILYDQALAAYKQGRFHDAEQALNTLILQSPDDTPGFLLLARVHANQGRLAKALTCCDTAIAADKMAACAHYLRAMILQEQNALPEALLALKQAVYVDPHFVLGHFTLGNISLKQRKLKESEKHFENALLLLARYEPEDIVPESEGLSAGSLREMIASPTGQGIAANRTGPPHLRVRVSQRLGNPELSRR